ncbi:MAG TPA: glycoside hydrolase family 15 protein [Jiangellaceae bacterium]|nr:glycoside hydrolase family 15 protein [Jiangellaceae bacterium]
MTPHHGQDHWQDPWQEFPPHVLREYALLADGHRGALCGPHGDLVWLCAPRWDSDAVLSSLIGGEGMYAVTPSATSVWGGYYEPRTLIWRSRWVTTDGIIESREALAYPADPHRAVVLRQVRPISGSGAVDVVLELRAGFGAHPMRELHRNDDGTWTARSGELNMRWSGGRHARVDERGALRVHLDVPAGSWHDLVLEISDRPLPEPPDPQVAWAATAHAWAEQVPEMAHTAAPRDARHSYAVLRGLTEPGGGMVAAATLGLPERAGAGRNYDYRYVWLRDQAYTGVAAAVTEPLPLMDDAVAFATARLLEHGSDLVPAYRVDGSDLPAERSLSLPGYPGGSDVVGNWVRDQTQLDTFGEILQLFGAAARHDHLDSDAHRAMSIAVKVIETTWAQPDNGIWEIERAWWTQSRLACVAGLRTIAELEPPKESARLESLAERILVETSRRCLDTTGVWRRSPEHPGTDASLLLPPVRGALAATDPRTRATLEAIEQDLTEDGYVYRFAHDGRALGAAEGAFLLCGFSMALAMWHQGRQTEAFRWFERNRAACGPPGLRSEEYDVQQGQLRGNIPQAFVHALLMESATRLPDAPPNEIA